MASINSVTGSLSATSSLRGFGGLASGLERDELIEQLTSGTRSKIEAQQQKKDKLGWQQSAIRSIIDKVYDYTNKYTSYASASNLTSSNLFSRTDVTAMGDNSKYVSVTGRSTTANTFSIQGIKQLASDAQIAGATASSSKFSTAGIAADIANNTFDMSMIAGQNLTFKVGGNSYTVTLGSGDEFDYKTSDGLAKALNDSFKTVEIAGTKDDGSSKTLADVLGASVSGGKVTFTNKDTAGNTIEIKSATGDALKYLGFLGEKQSISDLGDAAKITNGNSYTAANRQSVIQNVNIGEYLTGSTMTFNYNGTSKTIVLGETGEDAKKLTSMTEVQEDLQKKLDSAFGKGRIKVELDPPNATGKETQKLSFITTKPTGKTDAQGNLIVEEDKSSVFGITGGTRGLLGKSGLLGIDSGTSNKVNTSQSISKSGLNGASKLADDALLDLTINGKPITKDSKGNPLTAKSSIDDIMKAINENKDLGVTISYQRNSDRFIITSTEKGASGAIKLEGETAKLLFGENLFKDAEGKELTSVEVTGQDAIVSVQFAGDVEPTEIVRNSNSFTMDGLTVGLKDTFGYDKVTGEYDTTTEAITFDAKVDTDKTTQTVKEMIDAYNEIVELINKEVKTKPNRKYAPLTASQREDMSESEIKAYEEKAKEGLLFSDTDLRSFSDALRFVLPTSDRDALSKIGISVSTSYSDNGKLVLDEAKFRSALESDPETVSKLFTRTASVDEDGNKIEGGLMEKISNVMKRFAGTTGATKGILVERAGSSHAPTTVLKNSIQDQLDDIDNYIDRLLSKLEKEEDRYISQFTTLETLMSQMNSQSSYLSQLMGY